VNHISFVHVFECSAGSPDWASTFERLVWYPVRLESNVMLVGRSGGAAKLLLTMSHFDEVDGQWARSLLKIASTCHDRAVAV